MKSLFTILFCLLCFEGIAQSSSMFHFQGIARNGSGTPLASQAMSLRLTIHDASFAGTILYQETHNTTTNAFGLYDVPVGGGTVISGGNLSSIQWKDGVNKWMQVEIDPAGGNSFSTVGNTLLMAVPYALHATSADIVPAPTLTLTGTTLTAGGNSVTVPQATGNPDFMGKFTGSNAIGNSQVFDNGASVSIGTIAPAPKNKLEVRDTISTNGARRAIYAAVGSKPALLDSVIDPVAVYGSAQKGVGVAGVSDSSWGVFGMTNNPFTAGVIGTNFNGPAVWGSVGGTGVAGYFNGGFAGNGVRGFTQSTSATAYGVRGQNLAGAGYGIYGTTTGTGYAGYFNGMGSGTGLYATISAGNTGNAAYFNGNIAGTGTNNYASDRKLKKDIRQIDGALDLVGRIQPASYQFRVGEFGSMNLAKGKHYGVIAQELQQVLPELVRKENFKPAVEGEEGFEYLSVNYQEMIPILIKAIQELKSEVEILKAQQSSAAK